MKSPITNEDVARKQEGLWAVNRATTLNELRLIWKLYRHPEVRAAAEEKAKQFKPEPA